MLSLVHDSLLEKKSAFYSTFIYSENLEGKLESFSKESENLVAK